MYKKYCQYFIIFLFILALPLGSNWLFLNNSGELLPIEKVARIQHDAAKDCLVGLATRSQFYYYKKALYELTKPKILILGSSRVMEIRENAFFTEVVNAGGAMNSVYEGFSFINEAFAIHKPEVVILGLDYWWFNEVAHKPLEAIKPPLKLSHQISLRSYLLPFKWLWQRKISFNQYVNRLNPLLLINNDYPEGVGVDAIINHTGFGSEGSFYSTKIINGKEKNIDEKFHTCLEHIKTGALRFEYGSKVHDMHFKHIMNMIRTIQEQGVELVIFIPPNAPTVVNRMKDYRSEFKFIDDLRQRLANEGVKIYDFHDPAKLSSGDCEFLDGIHGGEVTYAKILLQLGQTQAKLQPYLNLKYLSWVTVAAGDLAIVPSPKESRIEVDFLKIGCDKSAQYDFSQTAQT